MEYLMHFCKNMGDVDCHPDVEKRISPKELKESEDIPLMPFGKEQEKLDEICKKCDSRFFVVKEHKCPICDDMDVEEMGMSEGISREDMIHEFKCNNCKETFGIHKINLN